MLTITPFRSMISAVPVGLKPRANGLVQLVQPQSAGDQFRFSGAEKAPGRTDTRHDAPDPGLHACRVCGLNQDDPPWGKSGFEPTYDICPCCNVEFGVGDTTPDQRFEVRGHWIRNGYPWTHPEQKPAQWDPDAQMAQIPEEYLLHCPPD